MFVGYGLADWNFRVIFKATAEGRTTRKSYAVQYYQPAADHKDTLAETRWDATVAFWGRRDVDILNMDASQFMKDLKEKVQEKVAQLTPSL